MSGPKGGGYAVVSPEELERRSLRAARDRYRRIRVEYNSVVASLGAYEQGIAPVAAAADGDSRAVTARAESLEAQIASLRSRLSDHRVAAALAAIPRITINLPEASTTATPSVREGATSTTRAEAPGSVPKIDETDSSAKADSIVAALVKLTGLDAPRDVLQKARGVRAATSPAQERLALDDLRFTVQVLRDRFREEQRAADQRDAVLAALDGCGGLEARRMHDAVSQLTPGQPVPITVEVALQLARADREVADAGFVESAVVDVLQELGYDVGDPMTVAVADRGALLELPGHADHVARLRTQDGQLRFSVVRVGGGAEDPAGDTAAEVTACRVFADVHTGLSQAGVEWTLDRHDAPGATRMAQANKRPSAVASKSKKGSRRRSANVERELDR